MQFETIKRRDSLNKTSNVDVLHDYAILHVAKISFLLVIVTRENWNDNQSLTLPNWWLVRVTLVVDWLFLPRNFGLVVGTYEAFCCSVNVHGVVVLC